MSAVNVLVRRVAARVRPWVRAGVGRLGAVRMPATSGNAADRVRRAGRWVLIRGLASAAFRPGRWGAGLAVAAFAVPGPWWFASIAIVPFGLYRWVSRPSGGVASPILLGVSRRVKSLRLRRTLIRSWTPLMSDLGFTKNVERRRLTRQLKLVTRTETLVPRLGRISLGEWGLTTTVNMQRLNLGVSPLRNATERIESGLRVPDCTIRKVGPGVAKMDLRHSDPLGEVVRISDLPEPKRYLHVVPARAADGSGVEEPLPPSRLVVGASRSGKSEYAVTLTKLILDQGIPLRLRIFAKEQEFTQLRGAAYDFETNPGGWPRMLGRWYGALQARQRSLAARGIKELRHFTDRDPLDLLILDEFLAVLAMRNADVKTRSGTMRVHAVLELMASQIIAAGFGIIALAQLGQKEVIGAVRDLFPTASILRVPRQAHEMIDAVLGPGAKALYPAHEIPEGLHARGTGYSTTPTGRVLRTRVAYLDDDERDVLVEQVRAETKRLRSRRAKADEPEMAEAAA